MHSSVLSCSYILTVTDNITVNVNMQIFSEFLSSLINITTVEWLFFVLFFIFFLFVYVGEGIHPVGLRVHSCLCALRSLLEELRDQLYE